MTHCKYKTLLVSGCSFTHNNGTTPFSWPHIIGQNFGLDVINLSIPGAGNTHISNSIMLALEKSNLNPKETLVMAMWSGVGRIDWITDSELSNFSKLYPFSYNYDEFNELTLGGNWWNIKKPSHLESTLIEYSKYQSDKSLSLHSWLAMKNLRNYLKVNGFDYYCTSFLNIFVTNSVDAITINFFKELDALKLELDGEVWLPLELSDYLGNFCKTNNLLTEDNFHPTWEGQQRWTREILVPCLKNEGIL